MESLSRCLSASPPPLLNPSKTPKSSPRSLLFLSNHNPKPLSFNSPQTLSSPTIESNDHPFLFSKATGGPNSQLLDIRDSKSVAYLGSPNLKILNKSAVQVEFREGDEDGFLKRILETFWEPTNTTVCIIDNFDGNSMKVAELLVKNGFKEAYAIRGGLRGKKGWQEIQETLLPPSVHIYPKKRTKMPKQLDTNGGIKRQDGNNDDLSSNAGSSSNNTHNEIKNDDFGSISPTVQSKGGQRPLSPYPNYPDFKPPSSPTPSKPN
ncbi:UNVERIFIED_CONTAM: Rhodanese-like domain-containing protein 4A, chloroplastic [Sesamum angustifolium]|uniref:Rhodanese-like domain-containing protein 4A, chloroplastic n=1 Tax=Sesamum angustifolium TaxID=2727405 RepID=A0AAW2QSN0_9LAMI